MMLAMLASCKEDEEYLPAELDEGPVEAALTLSVSPQGSATTRMSGDVVQAGGNFRGLLSLRAIPFATQGKVTASDRPKAFDTNGIRAEEYEKTGSSFYYFEGCDFMTGVSSFLVYGRAMTATNADGSPRDKAHNGSLTAVFPADANPAGISFVPDIIYDSAEAPADGTTMADCLTAVADVQITYKGNTYTWSAAANTTLRAYFLNYTGQGSQGTALLASSTANVQHHMSALRVQMTALHFDPGTPEALLRQAIIDAIDENYALLPANYPASINLPAGAAVVRWNGARFQPQTMTTTLAKISSIRRYAYPAELYYFANSQIKTSVRDDRHSFYAAASNWDGMLDQYEFDNSAVTTNTTAVAIKEPLQYAVGCLQLSFNDLVGSTLRDADGQNVTVRSTAFPLTGIIVGSQRPVGFDFVPTSDSDVDTRFVFDSDPVTTTGQTLYLGRSGTGTTNTLVLQTCDGEDVTLILEFQNDSGSTFTGLNGVVYPGTRFYLIGSVEPKAVPQEDYEKRAFTQDHTTRVGVTVASLAKAYNVMPDILTSHLEVGIRLTPQWVMATPTSVELE